jgi:hypothetical protein
VPPFRPGAPGSKQRQDSARPSAKSKVKIGESIIVRSEPDVIGMSPTVSVLLWCRHGIEKELQVQTIAFRRGATLDGSRGFQPTDGNSQRNVVAERQLKL